MSSMFRKKGGLAFKPKIPSARPRPTATPTNVPATKSIGPESVADRIAQKTLSDAPDKTLNTPESSESFSTSPSEELSVAQPESVDASEERIQHVLSSRDQDTTTATRRELRVTESQTSEPCTAENEVVTDIQTLVELASSEPNKPAPSIPQDNIAPELRDTPSTSIEASLLQEALASRRSSEGHLPVTQHVAQAPAASTSTAPKTRSRSRVNTSASQDPEANEDGDARPKKRQRKAIAKADGTATPKPRQHTSSTQDTATTPRTRARRARSPTPEDAENQTVDLQKLKMTDLTKDLQIGKKFSRHDELRERERQARLKSKLKKNAGDASRDVSEAPEIASTDQSGKSKSTTPTVSTPAAPAAAAGPQFRIVDGQIIVDQGSLVMDRHARAAATREDMETVEENDFTRLITSSSFMNTSKLRGPNIWTDDETELFYRGLGMFGTAFEMIAMMFPNKQRRHVKLKFNREERHSPSRIDAVLTGAKTVRLDIDEFKTFANMELESVEAIEAQQHQMQEDFEAEQKRIADEQAEIMRKKREELFADEEGNDDGSGKKKKKGKKNKGKETVQYGLNGEPITVEEP